MYGHLPNTMEHACTDYLSWTLMCLVTYQVLSAGVGGVGFLVRALISVFWKVFCLGWQGDSYWRAGYDVSYYILYHSHQKLKNLPPLHTQEKKLVLSQNFSDIQTSVQPIKHKTLQANSVTNIIPGTTIASKTRAFTSLPALTVI